MAKKQKKPSGGAPPKTEQANQDTQKILTAMQKLAQDAARRPPTPPKGK